MGPRELATWSGQAHVVHVARSHLDDGRGVKTGDNTNLPLSSAFSPMASPATKMARATLRIEATDCSRCAIGCATRRRQKNLVPRARSPRYRERNTRDTSRSLSRRINACRPRENREGLADVAGTHVRLVLGARSKRVRTVCVIYDGALFVSLGGHLIFCLSRASRARASSPKGAYAMPRVPRNAIGRATVTGCSPCARCPIGRHVFREYWDSNLSHKYKERSFFLSIDRKDLRI